VKKDHRQLERNNVQRKTEISNNSERLRSGEGEDRQLKFKKNDLKAATSGLGAKRRNQIDAIEVKNCKEGIQCA